MVARPGGGGQAARRVFSAQTIEPPVPLNHTRRVRLVVVHYHLRPGGIRRVIELATPHLVRAAGTVTEVTLLTGARADDAWHEHFAAHLPGVRVRVHVEPAVNYFSEQRRSPARIARRLRAVFARLFVGDAGADTVVWAHNLGVGRNLMLSRELAAACAARDVPLVAHHHDWWFDNRWRRWPELRRCGAATLAAAARAVFPRAGQMIHAAINHEDASLLEKHLGDRALWLPNLAAPEPPPPPARVDAAHHWLNRQLAHHDAPVWLLPCRTLRRKNIAEALLLTRWLRPGAWLVVTGTASSRDELPYFAALAAAARRHHWRLRLGVLGGDESRRPAIPELLAASEAVLLTSVQEGFGLPYLEAAAARRPLIARRLPNIAPDLHRFGFRFPQAYDEIWIAPALFNQPAERARQQHLFRRWCADLPAAARRRVAVPTLLAAADGAPTPFSRLTLTAQLEVLAKPAGESWAACAPLNPGLAGWRARAARQALRVTPWPRGAARWLGGAAYARRWLAAVRRVNPGKKFSAPALQADFLAVKLAARNLHPLLWHPQT